MNRITIMITGAAPRTVELRGHEETLADLVARLKSPDFPLDRVQSWYADSAPVANPATFQLRNGMYLGGTPKVDGGLG
jgi:hypothetical protein